MIIFLSTIVFLLFVLFIPIGLEFSFDQNFSIKLKLAGITIVNNFLNKKQDENLQTEQKNEIKPNADSDNSISDKIEKTKGTIQTIQNFLKALAGRIIVKNLEINVLLGTSDAALTALSIGSLYAFLHTFFGFVDNNFRIRKSFVQVTPDFDKENFKVNFLLSIKINIFSILLLLYSCRNDIINIVKSNKQRKMVF